MKHLLLAAVAALTLSGLVSAQNEALDALFDERIKDNEEYRDQYAKEAEDTTVAEELVPHEKESGQMWVDYLKHVKEKGDLKTKEYVLSLEYRGELSGAYWDLEYAEGVLEKTQARAKITKYKRKLEELDQLLNPEKAAKPEEKAAEPEAKE